MNFLEKERFKQAKELLKLAGFTKIEVLNIIDKAILEGKDLDIKKLVKDKIWNELTLDQKKELEEYS